MYHVNGCLWRELGSWGIRGEKETDFSLQPYVPFEFCIMSLKK